MDDIYGIAASGMAAQRVQMDLIAENLAHASLPASDGAAYRARSAVLAPAGSFEQALSGALTGMGDEAAAIPSAVPSAFDDVGLTQDAAWTSSAGSFPDMEGEGGTAGVVVADIVDDPQPVQYKFDPGNPFAVKAGPHKGYVALPAVDPIQEMVAMMSAGRAYDANVSMLAAAKQMDVEASDIDRLS